MPLYRYQCPLGHEAELIRPMGVDTVPCPCGGVAERCTANRVAHIGRAVIPRDQRTYRRGFSEYQEAAAEVEDIYTRVNKDRALGERVAGPNYFALAKSKAQAQGASIR